MDVSGVALTSRRVEIMVKRCDKLAYVKGTVIRDADVGDAPGIARVHVESWRTTYRGIVPDAFLDGMSYGESESRWRERLGERDGRVSTFVAEVSERIVGFAVGGPRRSESLAEYDGELYALYLLDEFRGTGIGRGLFGVAAERLSSSEFSAMIAWVMAKNAGARRFYEVMGGKLVGKETFEIEGKSIEEVAYGWDDVRGFVRASA